MQACLINNSLALSAARHGHRYSALISASCWTLSPRMGLSREGPAHRSVTARYVEPMAKQKSKKDAASRDLPDAGGSGGAPVVGIVSSRVTLAPGASHRCRARSTSTLHPTCGPAWTRFETGCSTTTTPSQRLPKRLELDSDHVRAAAALVLEGTRMTTSSRRSGTRSWRWTPRSIPCAVSPRWCRGAPPPGGGRRLGRRGLVNDAHLIAIIRSMAARARLAVGSGTVTS
jgi:hypothetical protein